MSIYHQIRSEGYRDGWGQASMVYHDDAYHKGQQSGRADAPKRWRWFAFGLAVGLVPLWWLI